MDKLLKDAKTYLSSRLEVIKAEKDKLCEKYNNTQLEIIEFDNQIKKLTEKIDTTYEIFSPKSNDSAFTYKELKNYETKKVVLVQENIDIHKNIALLENEEKTIECILDELETASITDSNVLPSTSPESADNIEVLDKLRFCVDIFDSDSHRVKLELINMLSSSNNK